MIGLTDITTNVFEFIENEVIDKLRVGDIYIAAFCYVDSKIVRDVPPVKATFRVSASLFEELRNKKILNDTMFLLKHNSRWLNDSFEIYKNMGIGKPMAPVSLVSNVRVPGFEIGDKTPPLSLFRTEEEAKKWYREKKELFNKRPTTVRFRQIEKMCSPRETIDELIKYLTLMKEDMDDTVHDERTLIKSIWMRNNSVQCLNDLLSTYLEQVGIKKERW